MLRRIQRLRLSCRRASPRNDASTVANHVIRNRPPSASSRASRRAASAGLAPRTSTGRRPWIVTALGRHRDVAGIDELVHRRGPRRSGPVHGDDAEGDDPVPPKSSPVASKSSDATRPGASASPSPSRRTLRPARHRRNPSPAASRSCAPSIIRNASRSACRVSGPSHAGCTVSSGSPRARRRATARSTPDLPQQVERLRQPCVGLLREQASLRGVAESTERAGLGHPRLDGENAREVRDRRYPSLLHVERRHPVPSRVRDRVLQEADRRSRRHGEVRQLPDELILLRRATDHLVERRLDVERPGHAAEVERDPDERPTRPCGSRIHPQNRSSHA